MKTVSDNRTTPFLHSFFSANKHEDYRLAEVLSALDIFGLGLASRVSLTGVDEAAEAALAGGCEGVDAPSASAGRSLLLSANKQSCRAVSQYVVSIQSPTAHRLATYGWITQLGWSTQPSQFAAAKRQNQLATNSVIGDSLLFKRRLLFVTIRPLTTPTQPFNRFHLNCRVVFSVMNLNLEMAITTLVFFFK